MTHERTVDLTDQEKSDYALAGVAMMEYIKNLDVDRMYKRSVFVIKNIGYWSLGIAAIVTMILLSI